MKIIYKEIAEYTNKTEAGIKKMKINNPKQLEIIKIGSICKKYNILIEDLKRIKEIKEKEGEK